MKLVLQLLSFCSIWVLVFSHGQLSNPTPRGVYAGKDQEQEIIPINSALEFNFTSFICRDDPVAPKDKWVSLTAGGILNVAWDFPAPHPGDCFIYMTYDADLPDEEKEWFKLASWANCDDKMNTNQTLTIPSYLPSSNHVIVRWEWYAIHIKAIGVIQWYCSCFDAKIMGLKNGTLPEPRVSIPGHLPQDVDLYRDPEPGSPFWFTGPREASLGGSSYTTGANPTFSDYTYGYKNGTSVSSTTGMLSIPNNSSTTAEEEGDNDSQQSSSSQLKFLSLFLIFIFILLSTN